MAMPPGTGPKEIFRAGVNFGGRVTALRQRRRQRHREAAGMGRGDQLLRIGADTFRKAGVERVLPLERAAAKLDRAFAAFEVALPYGFRSPACHARLLFLRLCHGQGNSTHARQRPVTSVGSRYITRAPCKGIGDVGLTFVAIAKPQRRVQAMNANGNSRHARYATRAAAGAAPDQHATAAHRSRLGVPDAARSTGSRGWLPRLVCRRPLEPLDWRGPLSKTTDDAYMAGRRHAAIGESVWLCRQPSRSPTIRSCKKGDLIVEIDAVRLPRPTRCRPRPTSPPRRPTWPTWQPEGRAARADPSGRGDHPGYPGRPATLCAGSATPTRPAADQDRRHRADRRAGGRQPAPHRCPTGAQQRAARSAEGPARQPRCAGEAVAWRKCAQPRRR